MNQGYIRMLKYINLNMTKKQGFYTQTSDKADKVRNPNNLKKEVQVSRKKIFLNISQSLGEGTE